jgi:hypothetical protein
MEGSMLLIPVLNPPKAGKRSKKVAKTKRRRSRRAKGTAATGKKKARRSRRRSTKKAAPKRRRSKSKASPKRRRRSRKAKANPKRRRSKSKASPKRRRRSRKAKANPKRRRKAKRNPKHRRRAKRNAPKRRRSRRGRRNVRYNGGKRRRSRRGRRNPGMGGAISGIRTRLKSLLQVQSWGPPALQGALGIGAASYGPQVLSRFTSQLGLRDSGLGGVVLSGVSTALAASLAHMAASYLPKGGIAGKATSGIARNVMIGGMIWTVVRLINEVAPGIARSLYLPRTGGSMSGMGGGMGGSLGMYGGHYPGQYPSNVYLPGLGMVTSPEDLVAGESAARQANEFRGVGDFMELSGMQDAVPFQDIRGMGGFGDWVELQSGSAPAMEQFNPATETF